MDPDLLAEYAMKGASGKDSQWVNGPSFELKVEYNNNKFVTISAFYDDRQTDWSYDTKELSPIKKITIHGYISVAFFDVVVKAILRNEEVLLFKTDKAEAGKTYETTTEIDEKECKMILEIKEK